MATPSLAVPTPSEVSNDGNNHEEKKDSYSTYEVEPGVTVRVRGDHDPTMDPKKLKRIIANRASAQRSKWRKQQYVENLEKKVEELQMSGIHSQIKMLSKANQNLEMKNRMLEERNKILEERNRMLEGRSFALRQRSISAQVGIEALIAEIEKQ